MRYNHEHFTHIPQCKEKNEPAISQNACQNSLFSLRMSVSNYDRCYLNDYVS